MNMIKRFYLIIVLLIVTVMYFFFFSINQLNVQVNEQKYDRLVIELRGVSNNFSKWINIKREMLDTSKDIVDNLAYSELIANNVGNPYLNINNDDENVSQIYVGLEDGGFITGGQWIPPADYDPRTRVWYREALEKDETIVSKVYIDRETGEPLVTISSPLYMEGRLVGVISADVFLNQINDYLRGQLNKGEMYSYIADQEGLIFIHTNRDDIQGTSVYEQGDVLINYFETAVKNQGIVLMHYDLDGQHIVGIVDKVEGVDWYLGIAMVDNQGLSDLFQVEGSTLYFSILLLICFLVLLFMVVMMKRQLDTSNKQLKIDNEIDFLTQIYNRRYFNLALIDTWKNAHSEDDISLLMMDVDYFKLYNDTYGHQKGDEILKNIASIVKNNIRKDDIFARYGGEEFTLLLNKLSREEAGIVAEKIRENVFSANIEHTSSPLGRLTISMGLVTIKRKDTNYIKQRVNMADMHMYKAKEAGKNQVCS